MEVVQGYSSSHICGGAVRSSDVSRNDVTGSCITGSDRKWRHRNRKWCHRKLHHRIRKWKGDNFPCFLPVFPAFISGTPLDSRYEEWNFESNQWWRFASNSRNNQSSAFRYLNPTNGKPSLNGQSSTFCCTFVYLKKVIFRSSFHIDRTCLSCG